MEIEDILQKGVDKTNEMALILKDINSNLKLRINMEAKFEDMEKRLDSIENCMNKMKIEVYPNKDTGWLGLFAEFKAMGEKMINLEDKIVASVTKNVEKIVEPIKKEQEENTKDIKEIKERNTKKDAIIENHKEKVSYVSIIIGIGASAITTIIGIIGMFIIK